MAGSACSVRAAAPADLLTILGIHARRDPYGQVPSEASDRERATWAKMMGAEDLTVYLAEVDGDPVATATAMAMPNLTYDCRPTAFVEAVVVVHDRRRQGIATTIMGRVLDDARAAGCNKVQLLSHKRHVSDGAHRLYTSLGFEAEAEGFRLYLAQVPAEVLAARPVDADRNG